MTGKYQIDINSDVGESFGVYQLGHDEALIPLISSANIACGFHAGDPGVMRRTIELAKNHGVAVGAHPGYPDLLGFGRRHLDVSPSEIRDYVIYQVGALQAFATGAGLKVQHVKAHGALYNRGERDVDVFGIMAKAVAEIDRDMILVAMSGPKRRDLTDIGRHYGIRIAFESFADRAYHADGTLVSRREPGAVIHDPAVVAQRVVNLVKEGKVTAVDGRDIVLESDTVCLHGDNPAALKLAEAIRESCLSSGITISPLGSIL